MLVSLFVLGYMDAGAYIAAAVLAIVVTGLVAVTRRRHARPRPDARRATAAAAVVKHVPEPVASPAPSGKRAAPAETHVRSVDMTDPIQNAFAAETGWRAIFGEDEHDRTMSRVIAWAVTTDADGASEVTGLIVDPNDPARIVSAGGVVTPEGHTLARYGFKES